MLWFLFARGRKPQCKVKSPRSLCFDKWQKLNSKSFVVLPNITWKFPSFFFLWFKDLFITWVNLPNKWEEHCKKEFVLMWRLWFTNIFFLHKMIKHVDLMIRNVGYINSQSKDIYVNFLVAVPGTVETAWPPEYFFGVGNFWGTIWPR